MSSSTLVLIGSGPGIGITTASLFARHKFSKVALISRNADRLAEDKTTLEKSAGKEVDVKTWSVDVTKSSELRKVFAEVEKFGRVSLVIFNAARVAPSKLLKFEEEEIVKDFMTTNIALYTTAQWAIPILEKETDKPTLLVTSGLLWVEPMPELFSLSLVKTAQRNLVQSLHMTYPKIHIAMLHVGGVVSEEDPVLNPKNIAEKFWDIYQRDRKDWQLDTTIAPSQ